ncbi:MAG TPA: HAMP domain-containing sensor histidine kinase [Aggregatilinea sp.]|jgi:PAS domain S-box-containing protein|uniref:PAS domain-containing sensor histidine kinase n=1 Tax=Aggregatilinea sp. TaxID=2806333 RepID=UPI002B63F062|nr:HAMP domain-containing sensor histidine kinase [Aggregatilinea sp.]HML20491.1 HAMP domain-containing sensor histidine kinase [Aggregatilinea sp.]
MSLDTNTLVISPAPDPGERATIPSPADLPPGVLEPQENVAQAMLDACQDGMLMFGVSGRLLYTNAAADAFLGESMRAYVGRSIFAWVHDRGWAHVTQVSGLTPELLRDMLSQANCARGEKTHRVFEQHVGGLTRTIDEQGKPVHARDGSAMGWMLTWCDITEQCQQAHMREEMNHMMIHDLRSPLTAIVGSLTMLHDLLVEASIDPAPYDEVLQIARNSSTGMLNLIESMLDLARIDQNGMGLNRLTQALPPIIDDACTSILSLAYSAHIELAIDVPEDLPHTGVDAEKIRRVLVNLLDNGLRHTPAGGMITVRASAMPETGKIIVSVLDTGPGIPVAERERIFDKFVQLGRRPARGPKGFGLGLTFCKLAVEAHGGRIWIEEAPGGGAAFCFSLPTAAEASVLNG